MYVWYRFLITITVIYYFFSVLTFAVSAQEATASADEVAETPTPSPTPLVPDELPTTGINLTVSPHFVNIATDPGEPVTSQIKVRNNSNVREYLQIQLARFEPDTAGESPVIVDIDPRDEFPSWVSFEQTEFALEPNENKIIRFTITPSSDAAFGYYYAVVVNRIAENAEDNSGAVITGAPAVPVLLEVRSPNTTREVQLVEFSTDRLFYEYLPVTFNIKVNNTGNIHVIPFGDIFIDWGGVPEVGIIPVNPTRGNVLPNTSRTYASQWDDAFIVRVPKEENGRTVTNDVGETLYEVRWDLTKGDKFRIGKYTANLLLVYDNGQRDVPIEQTISFWVVPIRLILAIIGILLGPPLLVYIFMRMRYGKRAK